MAGIFQMGGGCGCCGGTSTCQICVTATSCGGTAVSGATVTVTQGVTTIGTCTTDASGNCCVDVTSTGSGTYNVAVSKTSHSGSNKNVSVTCPGTTNVALSIDAANTGTQFSVAGCNYPSPLPGATVTFNGGTYITASTGFTQYIPSPPGTYSWSIAKSRFNTATGSTTVNSSCAYGLVSQTLTPATGYTCDGTRLCADPILNTLAATCAVGSLTLTVTGSPIWIGCGYFSSSNVDDCSGGVTTGNVPYSIEYTPGGGTDFSIFFFSNGIQTKYSGGTWSTCDTAITGACVGASRNGPIHGTETSVNCPASPPYTASGSVSGYTGLFAVFNGAWTITE